MSNTYTPVQQQIIDEFEKKILAAAQGGSTETETVEKLVSAYSSYVYAAKEVADVGSPRKTFTLFDFRF